MNRIFFAAFVLFLVVTGVMGHSPAFADSGDKERVRGVFVGMTQERFSRIYPKKKARTYHEERGNEWITFSHPFRGEPVGTVTFFIRNGKILEWHFNDRTEVVKEYLGEFCSQGIVRGMPKMYAAIKEVFERIALKDFLNVTDRRRPVLITEYYDSGTARFANTSEIIAAPDDAPAGEGGLTIIKLSSALNEVETPLPIEGVIAHELAHRVLDHARLKKVTCAEEREANNLIARWGFAEEFSQAKKAFGHKDGEPSSCQE